MGIVDRSLHKLMRINRIISEGVITPPITPDPPTDPPINPPGDGYILSDFGENAINNHRSGDENHSKHVQAIFNYVVKDFADRCTCYESYKTPILDNKMIGTAEVLKYCKIVNADIIMTPYVGAANWMEGDFEGFVMGINTHYNNDGQFDTPIGDDNNRHDITPNAETFKTHSIAVSARRDTPELFKNSTSEGFGMEFFEDASKEGLAIDFPNKDIDTAFAGLLTEDGTLLYSTQNLYFSQYVEVGELITIRYSSDPSSWVDTNVTEIIDANHIKVSPAVPLLPDMKYGYHKTTLGAFIQGNTQSYAIPVVAGKLKVIKMTTGADWATVRAAARATAKRNPTGIPEIDNTNWDIYRGFGSIQVQAAINYINN